MTFLHHFETIPAGSKNLLLKYARWGAVCAKQKRDPGTLKVVIDQ